MRGVIRRGMAGILAVALLATLGAASAQAATVSVHLHQRPITPFDYEDYGVLVFRGGDAGSALTITDYDDGSFHGAMRVVDTVEEVAAGDGCVQDGDHAAICNADAAFSPMSEVDVGLGGGDDRIEQLAGAAGRIEGGAGDDVLVGTGGDDVIAGGDDDDEIAAGGGADTVDGGAGTDTIDGGTGNDGVNGGAGGDDLAGGAGVDLVSYEGVAQDVTIDLSAPGPGGDGDHLMGFESATGGDGDDTLTGSDGPNELDGGPGDDAVDGLAGDDTLTGGPGENDLTGGDGSDTLDESAMDQDGHVSLGQGLFPTGTARYGLAPGWDSFSRLFGIENARTGAGDDELVGDAGRNVLQGGSGNDALSGRGGDDLLRGDGDDDTLWGAGGRDELYGSSGADVLRGEDDDDFIDASYGEDVALGGPGDDVLRPGGEFDPDPWGINPDMNDDDGDDHVSGGDGTDRVDYSLRVHPVVVDLGVAGGHGMPSYHAPQFGENDVIEDVESVSTGSGDDRIRGAPGFNVLDGGPSQDRIEARDGGPDEVRCGQGVDTAVVDAVDATSDCETVELPAPEPPPASTPPGDPPALADDVTSWLDGLGARGVARRARRGVVIRVPVSFLRAGTLTVTLRVGTRIVARGSARRSTPGRALLRLRLSRVGRRLLRRARARRLRVAALFAGAGASGPELATRTVRLSRARR